MSYTFGKKSQKQLDTLYPILQNIFLQVLETDDFSVDQGGRTDEQQWEYYNKGTSTLHPPNGKHLLKKCPFLQSDEKLYAFAADVTPWIKGKRLATHGSAFGVEQGAQFAWFLRKMKEVADELLKGGPWRLRFGINWDSDEEILTDQNFDDWFHLELVLKETTETREWNLFDD